MLNWMNYRYWAYDGYGRFGLAFVRVLVRLGVDVRPLILEQVSEMPGWMQRMAGLDLSRLTISCMPPHCMPHLPGRQWAFTMCEGTRLPPGWADMLNVKAERVLVPCEHNAKVFRDSGVRVPVSIVLGGTSPEEFPVLHRQPGRPYVFLALADRGSRKGWVEVWQAFYRAFGAPENTPDVRLLIKTQLHTNELVDRIARASGRDRRISFWQERVQNPADVYALADCVAIPSRSEGWGMPQREAAMMGLPVIVTRYSGLDDGHTDEWAIVLDKLELCSVPRSARYVRGKWIKADVTELAEAMRWCYEHPGEAAAKGRRAAEWLQAHQTWEHAARRLVALLERYG